LGKTDICLAKNLKNACSIKAGNPYDVKRTAKLAKDELKFGRKFQGCETAN